MIARSNAGGKSGLLIEECLISTGQSARASEGGVSSRKVQQKQNRQESCKGLGKGETVR